MADRVIFVGSSPEDFMRGALVPEEMVSDLLVISGVTPEVIERVGAAVERADGFLNDTRLETLIKSEIQDETTADAIFNALRNLRHRNVDRTLTALAAWRDADPRHAGRFPEEALTDIQYKLRQLIRPSAALERHREATRLGTSTGHQAKNMQIICDARPVFDLDQSAIDGFVTQTVLKLVYETQTDDTRSVEVVLTPEQLGELADEVEKAKKRLDVLRTSIRSWIPDGLAEDAPNADDENEDEP